MPWFLSFLIVLMTLFVPVLQGAEQLSVKQHDNGLDIYAGTVRVAGYVHTEEPLGRPFLCNVRTLDGIQVTRNYPVQQGDQDDHPHHQGIFHTFSQVNGVDYWHMRGVTKQRRFIGDPTVTPSGNAAGFVAENVYLGVEKKTPQLKEVIDYRFLITDLGLLLVVDAVITAEAPEVKLGSKEEGGLAVRMSSDLRVESGASMMDDQGRSGGAAIWGKATRWVDNSGEKKGRWVGITLMTHPANGRLYHWHARDYGLLATNPLGPLNTGPTQVLKQGDSMRFRYGVMVHSSRKRTQYNPAAAQKVYERHSGQK